MHAHTVEEQNETFKPHYIGDVVTKWLRHDGDDRLMQLRENFTFVESQYETWIAPAGFIFDGTTIPRARWRPAAWCSPADW